MKEQDLVDSTKKSHSFIDKESVMCMIKNYQKEKMVHSLLNKERSKVINKDINSYQDEENINEDTKAYPDINNKRRGYIHYGHQYKQKKNEKNVEMDCKEQSLNANEKQEENTQPQEENAQSLSETDSAQNKESNEKDSIKNEKETTSNEDIFTEDKMLEMYGHHKSEEQTSSLKDSAIYENDEKTKIERKNKKENKTQDTINSKKQTYISKKKKKQSFNKNKRTGDGSIDKDNEANAIIDSVAKARDLKVMIPQTVGQVKDKTVLAVTGTVHIVSKTASDIRKSVSDAKVFANKVNGLIKKKQYTGVHQAKTRDSKKIIKRNKTSHNRLKKTSKNVKKNKKDMQFSDKKNVRIGQDVRRKMIQVVTTPESNTENNMSTGISSFAKEQAEKYAQSKMREIAAKVGKTAFVYTGKFIMMLLKFAITVIVQAITFMLSLAPLFLLPILIIVVIVGLFSYFFGGADVDSTNSSYVAVKLNDKYDAFEDTVFQWKRNNKQGISGYDVIYEKDCSDFDNFNEVLNLYLVYSIEAQEAREDYLSIDTDEEEERLNKAFELFNYTYITDEGKILHVVKQTYEEIENSLSDTQKDYYALALQAHGMGEEEGYAVDRRIIKENRAEKALENSPKGTLPMTYEELKEIFTWMNDDNVYPIDDEERYVTSQYTLVRTDVDENHTSHYGVDFTSAKGIGTNLVAIADAVVYKIVSVEEDGTGYGNHLILRFNDGTYALYAHMNDFIIKYGTNAEYDEDGYEISSATDEEYLKEGDQLKAGDLVGHMGNTGDSFGAHLHLVLSTSAYGSEAGSRYDFNDYVACVWVKDFDYSYDY